MLPAAIFSVAMVAYPVARTAWLSVHNGNLSRPRQMNEFVGLQHYQRLLQDGNFWHALVVMVVYAFAVTALAYAVGLAAALLLDRRTPFTSLSRTLLTLPWAVPGVVAGFVFVWMFDASFGVGNYILRRLGIVEEPVMWLLQSAPALVVVIIAAVWKTIPFNMLTHLAGLQAVPHELREAARVDGANAWQEFRHIVWPALGNVRVVAILITTLHSFREFGQIYVITGGGPARATETLSVQIYTESFGYFRFGYASAIGVVLLLISLVFTVATVRTQRTSFF
jgi:multiple sugar transport system permease protein